MEINKQVTKSCTYTRNMAHYLLAEEPSKTIVHAAELTLAKTEDGMVSHGPMGATCHFGEDPL